MSIEKLTSTVIETAKEKAKEIKEKYTQEIKKLQQSTEEQLTKLTQEHNERVTQQKQLLTTQLLSNAYLTAQKEILQAKWTIINEIFNKAVEKFINSNHYYQILNELIAQNADNNTEIVVNKKDYEEIKKHNANLKLTVDENLQNGIIIKKGRIELNYTIDKIVSTLKNELIIELSNLLFTK
ncbi:MAG: V-type ATP synthase subunit E family protein [candidate division WOR-3 bacterium]